MLATHSVAHKGESTSQKTWDFLSHIRRKYRKTFRQCWGFDLKGKVRRSLNFAGSRTKINSTKPFPPSPSRKGSRLNLFVRHNINFSTVELIRQKRLQTDKVCGWLWIWMWVRVWVGVDMDVGVGVCLLANFLRRNKFKGNSLLSAIPNEAEILSIRFHMSVTNQPCRRRIIVICFVVSDVQIYWNIEKKAWEKVTIRKSNIQQRTCHSDIIQQTIDVLRIMGPPSSNSCREKYDASQTQI